MDSKKIGKLLAALRKEKGLTQKDVSNALGIMSKTVSKWECGWGCPDLSYWASLSTLFGVDVVQLMEGEITHKKPDIGNVNKIRLYVCPSCGNILTSISEISSFCCGRKLNPLVPREKEENVNVSVEEVDTDYYFTINHPMNKEHYLSFVVSVENDCVFLRRLYPEQESSFRIPLNIRGKIYVHCMRHGLYQIK